MALGRDLTASLTEPAMMVERSSAVSWKSNFLSRWGHLRKSKSSKRKTSEATCSQRMIKYGFGEATSTTNTRSSAYQDSTCSTKNKVYLRIKRSLNLVWVLHMIQFYLKIGLPNCTDFSLNIEFECFNEGFWGFGGFPTERD